MDITTATLVSLFTLTALEIVLGVDNVIFIAILSSALPKEEQHRARRLGIAVAVISRLILVALLFFVINGGILENDLLLFEDIGLAERAKDAIKYQELDGTGDFGLSLRDIVLIIGGLFLIGKSTHEIHKKLEGDESHGNGGKVATLRSVLIQVMIIDVVFSVDSVLTAMGIAEELWVMIVAILISAAIMVFFANPIADFVERHPTFKILALAFLILIGSVLVIEGWNEHLAHEIHIKNYVYFAMAFAVLVEVVQMRLGKSKEPVHLKNSHMPESGD